MLCPRCGVMISKDAVSCPYCRQEFHERRQVPQNSSLPLSFWYGVQGISPAIRVAIFLIAIAYGLIAYSFYQFCLNDALNYAVKNGDLNAVKALVAKGANVNGRSMHFQIPLMSAVMGGDTEVVVFLISKGADVNATAYHRDVSVLSAAVIRDNIEIVRILVKHGADVNFIDRYGESVLTRAKKSGHTEIIKILEQAGAKERPTKPTSLP